MLNSKLEGYNNNGYNNDLEDNMSGTWSNFNIIKYM